MFVMMKKATFGYGVFAEEEYIIYIYIYTNISSDSFIHSLDDLQIIS